jgi:phosphatidylinositol glycan class N
LVVWGAGLSGPLPVEPLNVQDEFTLKWGLAHLKRRDVQQADIAALMAALLATPTPTNNVVRI